MNKNDRRYQRTRKNIKDAFLQLLGQQPFEKITINDIAELADINRSTFYLHYEDKYALLNEIISDKLSFLVCDSEQKTPEDLFLDANSVISHSLECLLCEKDFFKIMMKRENAPFFTPAFHENIAAVLRPLILVKKETDPEQREFEIQLRMSALSGILEWWIKQDEPMSIEKMTQNMAQVLGRLES